MILSIISDELAPDLAGALQGCRRLGLNGVELRTLGGRSVVDLDDGDVDRAVDAAREAGLTVVALATPVLKCSLPGLPAPAGGALHGARAAATIDDSWRQLDRALELAALHSVPFVRVFSGWRVDDPAGAMDRVAETLAQAQERSAGSSAELLLENEHDCNIATARETEAVLASLPGLRIVWDPANHVRGGGPPGESALDRAAGRIAHVHLKDVDAGGTWVPLGTGLVPYAEVLPRLLAAGYDGAFSLETHCQVDGSVEAASRVALEHLRDVTGAPV